MRAWRSITYVGVVGAEGVEGSAERMAAGLKADQPYALRARTKRIADEPGTTGVRMYRASPLVFVYRRSGEKRCGF